jgi:DNA-binding transcriptional MerR regulator
MDLSTHELMTVGRFAVASGLSARALRLYDAAGLLSPAETDESSGYRRYPLSQLGRARLIRLLREGDLPLEVIASILDAPVEAQLQAATRTSA